MVGTPFKPFFIGHFEVRGDVTVLIGKFTMLPLVKVFMSFWFGMCGLFAGAVLLGGFKPQARNATLFLAAAGLMISGGIALVAAGKWFARNDAAWLSELIATALGAPLDGASVNRDAHMNVDADTVPMTLKVAAIFLAASGAMALVAGVGGPHLWPSLGPASESTASPRLGNWNYLYALLVIALSIGIWGLFAARWCEVFWVIGIVGLLVVDRHVVARADIRPVGDQGDLCDLFHVPGRGPFGVAGGMRSGSISTELRYLPRNEQNGRRALQAHDAGSAHENRLLDVRDGTSHHRIFVASQPDAPRATPCVR